MLVVLTLMTAMSLEAHEEDIYELSLEENLETPVIKSKYAEKVQDYQNEQAIELIKQNYEVELMRDKEIIIITIPAEKLFGANDTILTASGKSQIKRLLPFLKNPGFYKMLLVMHSDNTGSKNYLVQLTRSRVNAVFDWIAENAKVDYVVPYALGGSEPLYDNNSMLNRSKNRRLEIYLVPEEVMLNQAKRGTININLLKK